MKFLYGKALTQEIQKICKIKDSLDVAVAYWGKDALKLTGLQPRRRNVRLICCLAGGSSDPDIIEKFGARARQNDALHAKVIWTKTKAIVSSANISSNGLPEEEASAGGLIEAGLLVTDLDELAKIKVWFERQYKLGRLVSTRDLRKAREARFTKLWSKPKIRRSFIEALEDGGAQEFKQQRISFALWADFTSRAQNKEARRHFWESAASLEQTLKIDKRNFKGLDWFLDWSDLPTDTFLISCRIKSGTFTYIETCRTFSTKKSWPIVADGEKAKITYVLGPKLDDFGYRLSARDKRILKLAARDLWRSARGSSEGRLLTLQDAAPILLRYASA